MRSREERMKWFKEDRFGMFIHWGIYAVPAKGEWVQNHETISRERYRTYFEEFDPVRYDARAWAKAAKQAGMKYAVLTTKHHDGFCLFDSMLTEFKSTNTPCGRDLVREFVDAFRAEGLRVGFYYSLLDWNHEHYPTYGDFYHPERANEAYKDKEQNFDLYVDYLHGQVRELLTNYGTIDLFWFDFSYESLIGEAWRATELAKMVYELQPGILMNNRLDHTLLKNGISTVYGGDFASPEQAIPTREVMSDIHGHPIEWEACITLNKHWGYHATDTDYKQAKDIIRLLVDCVSKDGNLLVNVGPNAKGEIPKPVLDILAEIGQWMALNGFSIYGCRDTALPVPEWGRFTQKDGKLYAHLFERGMGAYPLKRLKGRIGRTRLLWDGAEVTSGESHNDYHTKEDAHILMSHSRLPDDNDTVIQIELLGGSV
ncbi:alpha-L-fucosidase [Paenibacillus mendelii]|uniref:alpha-L-fucosidase n=1 Tax=Paenibacillus mendelii TaxID=206163 RepID=A0ABV6JC65_9BACL|nr:alpha-L-fucosidase [Paenibacillus mendelii]MCQ6561500.1 alpha-L-fucosidase [Paenibacillus mendelii]